MTILGFGRDEEKEESLVVILWFGSLDKGYFDISLGSGKQTAIISPVNLEVKKDCTVVYFEAVER